MVEAPEIVGFVDIVDVVVVADNADVVVVVADNTAGGVGVPPLEVELEWVVGSRQQGRLTELEHMRCSY